MKQLFLHSIAMQFRNYILFYFLLCLFCGCGKQQSKSSSVELISTDSIYYAKGFSVHHFPGYTEVEVHDPWDSTKLLQRYLLIDRNEPIPADLPKGTVVRVPIQNIAVYTSVHAAMLDQLGVSGDVIAVCEPRYMDTPAIQTGLQNGSIVDLGEATSPKVELMIDNGVEIVLASPFQNSSYGPVEKIGIPIIQAADYMESLPLGRTEWIRFYGLLTGKEALADSIFYQTEHRYNELKSLITPDLKRPTVFSEKKYGGSWYVPGGESYVANLYQDAGADYLFSDLAGSGSIPLAFETVFDQGIHADIWLLKYNQAAEMNYSDLKTEYSPYANFDAFKNGQIYTCNTGIVPFYEEFPLHPDYLLEDMIWIFHPELLPGYAPRYYRPMNK